MATRKTTPKPRRTPTTTSRRKPAAATARKRAAPKKAKKPAPLVVTSVTALERALRGTFDRYMYSPTGNATFQALCAVEGPSLEALCGYVARPGGRWRARALQVLGEIGKRRGAALVAPTLARFLSVPHPWHDQVTALNAAVEARAEDVRPHAARLVTDDAGFVRAAAMRYLAAMPDAQTGSLLRDALARAHTASDLASIALALGQLGDREAVPALVGLFDHKSTSVVCAAVTALGQIGDPLAEGPIASLRKAVPNVTIKRVCGRALENLRRRARNAAKTARGARAAARS